MDGLLFLFEDGSQAGGAGSRDSTIPMNRRRGTGRTHTLAERFTLALTPTLSTGFVSIPETLIRPAGTFSHSRGRRKAGERETSFPRVGDMAALDWRRFKGSMRECPGEISPVLTGEGRGRREAWFPRMGGPAPGICGPGRRHVSAGARAVGHHG